MIMMELKWEIYGCTCQSSQASISSSQTSKSGFTCGLSMSVLMKDKHQISFEKPRKKKRETGTFPFRVPSSHDPRVDWLDFPVGLLLYSVVLQVAHINLQVLPFKFDKFNCQCFSLYKKSQCHSAIAPGTLSLLMASESNAVR